MQEVLARLRRIDANLAHILTAFDRGGARGARQAVKAISNGGSNAV